jgi:hypothetical protein
MANLIFSGIFTSRIGYGLGVSAGDINNDGCIDIYVSNDFHENDYLYVNNCDGTFTEKIRLAMGHTTKSSMGNDMADFNNDGKLDIFSLDMYPEDPVILKNSAGEEMMEVYDMKEKLGYYYQLSRNALQFNRGREVFSEIAAYANVYATDWSWSPLFFDADNDGYKDLFITNGIPRRPNDLDYLQFLEDNREVINTNGPERISNLALIEQMPSDTIANYAFRNNHDLTFSNMADVWGLDHKAFSNTSVYADLDNDGDLDFIVSNLNENCFIYRNNSESITSNNFIKIHLKGPEKNNLGFGTRVEIWLDGEVQVQQAVPTRGAMSAVDPSLTFGIGSNLMVDSVFVFWPGDRFEKRGNVNANQTLTFDYLSSEKLLRKPTKPQTYFLNYSDSINIRYIHKEADFSDFDFQKLLPHKLSTQGPEMACGDVDGNGLDDLYICGGADQAGVLYLQDSHAGFVKSTQQAFTQDIRGDETGASFFDADSDGDPDLFVAVGSSEHVNESHVLGLKYYQNAGSGRYVFRGFISSGGYLPTCLAPHDYDADGDIDLFVGTRSNLLAYGTSGENLLLQNDGAGNFRNMIETHAQSIQSIGMVTDAAWADINSDGSPELLVVGEWMAIKAYEFRNGNFVDVSTQFGLANTTGWWSSILCNDLDNDGDVDIVAGNLGLNAKIKGSVKRPATMLVKDFDGNGTIDPVIFTFRDSVQLPYATRDDLVSQIPSLKSKFRDYDSYARVRGINDIFSDHQLEESTVLYAEEFRSILLENDGRGAFTIRPLPKEAQLFPISAIMARDFNDDGIKDILLGGNLHDAHITFGRYDAGYGLFLEGLPGLEYMAQPIERSGLLIRGEVRDFEEMKFSEEQLIFVSKSDAAIDIFKVFKKNKASE